MLRKAFLVAASMLPALAFGCLSASAGDYYHGSLKDGPIEQVDRWTGLYIGGVGTYDWTNIDYPDLPSYNPNNGKSGPPRPKLGDGLGGVTFGYNHQFGRIVVGIEGDYSWGNLGVTEHDGNYLTETFNVSAIATVRGRLGVVVGNFLPFITAGAAFEQMEWGTQCPAGAAFGTCKKTGAFDLRDNQWNTGYVAGGGVEWAATEKISLKIEGLYTNYGRETYNVGTGPFDLTNDEALLRVGLNLHY
ncbi:outer membrane protein [Hyphomicrobium sp. 2TAF46]|uniref:outer membrane protein n=1 Tax=Hyphomicrobium sp. 2TAF46 TaxID=3233019 RepID=UPI003F9083B0